MERALTLLFTPIERVVRYCLLKPIWGSEYDTKKDWQPEGPLV